MNCHAEILGQVIDNMLAQRNAKVASFMVREKLILMLLTYITDMGKCVSNGATHAGRTVPCYFDVERAFRLFGIQAKDLRAIRNAQMSQTRTEIVNFVEAELRDDQIHRSPQLDMNQQRGMRAGYHIPKYLPPYPSLHTYRNTMMDNFTVRNYVTERKRLANLHIGAQRAINNFYLGTETTRSLFTDSAERTEFMVLAVKLPRKPAFLEALMPRDEIFDLDIYEFNETPSEKALTNAFLKSPRIVTKEETTNPAVQESPKEQHETAPKEMEDKQMNRDEEQNIEPAVEEQTQVCEVPVKEQADEAEVQIVEEEIENENKPQDSGEEDEELSEEDTEPMEEIQNEEVLREEPHLELAEELVQEELQFQFEQHDTQEEDDEQEDMEEEEEELDELEEHHKQGEQNELGELKVLDEQGKRKSYKEYAIF